MAGPIVFERVYKNGIADWNNPADWQGGSHLNRATVDTGGSLAVGAIPKGPDVVRMLGGTLAVDAVVTGGTLIGGTGGMLRVSDPLFDADARMDAKVPLGGAVDASATMSMGPGVTLTLAEIPEFHSVRADFEGLLHALIGCAIAILITTAYAWVFW